MVRRAVRERDADPVGRWLQAGAGGPEADLGTRLPGPGHQDARQVGPEYAHHGRQVRAAGLGRGKLGEQSAVRVRSAHREPVE